MRVKIEKLIYGGEGLARDAGTTVFVPFVLPGEEAEIGIVEQKKNFIRARLENILLPSLERIEPRCPYFRDCGGCDYQHIPYESQLKFKEEILRETLHRLGHIDWQQTITVHASPPWGYRNRAQWKVRTAAANVHGVAKAEEPAIGYFRARSSSLCAVATCAILSPKLLAAFDALRQGLAEGAFPSTLREVAAFADAEDQNFILHLTCSSLRGSPRNLAADVSRKVPGARSVLVQDATGGRMELDGPGFLQYNVDGAALRVGHLSFFQVNRFLVEEMARTVAAMAGSGGVALDLFAGVGLFSIMLAKKFTRVDAVEADPASARDLELNAGAARRSIKAKNASVEHFLARWNSKNGHDSPDVAVLDPPRAGVERAALDKLIEMAPHRILYVSCDPATLARDLSRLCEKTYRAEEIHLFDMFPQTYHIETLVRLERRG